MTANVRNVAVIGGGSWATAIAKILLNNVEHLYWWVREEEIKDGIQTKGRNPLYLTGVEFDPSRISISNNMKEIIGKADLLVFVIPSAFFVKSMEGITAGDLKGKYVCSATKGIILETNQVVGEYMRDYLNMDMDRFSVISGPSHAEEIALGRLTYLTSASLNLETAEMVAGYFQCFYVKTRLSQDVYGIEYAGVIKNVYALSVGIAQGLGYGDNFVAVLVANAVEEMNRFLKEVHSIDRQLNASPYIGDLLVTAYSQFSRNRTFGGMIGRGYSVKSAIIEMKMVAEGYYAGSSVHKIKKEMDISMPILESVHAILYDNKSAKKVFAELEKILV